MAQVTRDIIQLKKSETGEVFYPETHADAVIGLGTAAKTDSSAYATSTQGSHADDAYNLVKGNKNINTVLAGPASGSAGAASFRKLVENDIPNLSWSKITTDKPTTISGYGITDAKIENGIITLGNSTITPLVSHQTLYNLVISDSSNTVQLTYKPNVNGTYSLKLTKALVGLDKVENTALSTWTGTNKITTVGTITSGVWNGTKIGYNYLGETYIGTTRTQSSSAAQALTGISSIKATSAIESLFEWDATNKAWHFKGGIYSDSFVSAGGLSDSSGTSGIDEDGVWTILDATNEVIGVNHIPNITTSKISDLETWIAGKGYVTSSGITSVVKGTDTSGGSVSTNNGVVTIQFPTAYTLPLATSGTRGGIKIGYTQSGKNYPVQLSSEKAYVNVPWTDTTYSTGTSTELNTGTSTETRVWTPKVIADYVTGLISAIDQFHYEIASSTSAVTNPASNILYLIGPTGSGSDKYEEYVYTNTWVKIGDTSIDLSGYQPLDADLTAIAGLTGTSGFLKKTAANTWALDTNTYLTTSSAASTYLPFTGGTVHGDFGALRIKRDTNAYAAAIGFENTEGSLGFIGVNYQGKPMFAPDTNTEYYLWHTGNLTKSAITGLLEGDSGYYVKKSGDTMTGKLIMSARIDMDNNVIEMGSGMLGAYNASDPTTLYWYDTAGWRKVYHSGNANLATVPWNVSTLQTNANGTSLVSYNNNITAESDLGGQTLHVGPINAYGLYTWVQSNGNTYIQSGRHTGATRYNVILQPFGGRVGIGVVPSYMLDVNGTTHTTSLKIGAGAPVLSWDADASAWHLSGNFYADGFISAGGVSSGGSASGVDLTAVWNNLIANTGEGLNKKIHTAHLPTVTITGTNISGTGTYSGTGGSASTLTLNLTAVDTTYSAGTGISLSGTTFSLNVAGAKTALGLGSNAYTSTAYLPLAGGAMNTAAVISRTGQSVGWYQGRLYPIIKTTSYTGYNAILSMKTTNGSWDLGVYNSDTAYLTYITDENYSAGNNAVTYQLTFPKASGTIALTSQIPTNNNQLTNGAGYLTATTAASTYVKFDPGASEQTIKSSISSFVKGVINLWRSSGDHYTFLGFSNGTTETYLGGIGFKSQSDHNLYRKDGSNYYKILDENNYTSYVNTTNFPGLNKTGTVTSVATGIGLTGGTITGSGTISINSTYQTYISNGNTAYGWGNHANAGYLLATTAASTYVSGVALNGNYLRVTKNGANTDLTIPYATMAQIPNWAIRTAFDPNAVEHAIESNYGESGSTRTNVPNEFLYGSVLTLSARGFDSNLSAQFLWDVRHGTDYSGWLWFRTKDSSSGWRDWTPVYTGLSLTRSVVTNLIGTTTYAPYNTNGYLPLTGGIIRSASSYARLRFVTDATAAYIQAATSDANSGNLYLSALNGGVGSNLYLKFSSIYATGANYTVYHSGNFVAGTNYQTPQTTLAGYGITDWLVKYASTDSPDTFTTSGIYRVNDQTGTSGTGYDFRYGNILVVRGSSSSDTLTQLAFPFNSSNIYFRTGNTSSADFKSNPWKKIWNSGNSNLSTVAWAASSFTAGGLSVYNASNIELKTQSSQTHGGYIDFHYAGSTADYTSRIIENASGLLAITGQLAVAGAMSCASLTASGNIQANAGATIANNQSYGGLDTGGTRRTLLNINSSNQVFIAYGASAAGYNTIICGNDIAFNYGTSHASGMYLNASGNVGISTTAPAYKLDVNGSIGCSSLTASDFVSALYMRLSGYSSRITTAGWRRFYTASVADNLGNSVILHINRAYSNNNNESYTIAVNIAYNGGISVTQLNGYANQQLITKIRVDYTPSGALYVDFYSEANSGSGNTVYVTCEGRGSIQGPTTVSSPTGTTKEYTLITNGLATSGNIVATGAITAGSASDARLKTNIQSLSAEAAKRIVMALNPVTFTWNGKATELYNQYKGDDLGMIAQEVEPYLPQAVGTIFQNYKRLDYTKVISPLVKVAQDHESRIRQLEAENRELRKQLNMN